MLVKVAPEQILPGLLKLFQLAGGVHLLEHLFKNKSRFSLSVKKDNFP